MSNNLITSLDFLRALAHYRIALYFGQETPAPELPVVAEDDDPFTLFIQHRRLTVDEFVMLITALVPHVLPGFFEAILEKYLPQGGDFTPIGGVKGINTRSLLPTGETVMFLLAGEDLPRRAEVQQLLGSRHFFSKERLVYLEEMRVGEPVFSGRLILDPEQVQLFTLGYAAPPRTGTNFPAQQVETVLDWDDLVLNQQTRSQLQEIETWIRYNDALLFDWKMHRHVKPGFRALFYGPPGTGKTMAAGLLGKHTNHDVYRIDLSMIVSKFIGETEKNMAGLFEKAENKKWILFFDEADALFGKRTNVKDAHDRYANQEVSYLLQKIEEYPGLCILASNFKSNLDDAFARRFQCIVYFPVPKVAERLTLWQNTIPQAVELEESIALPQIAETYELTGSNIVNVVHFCCLQAMAGNTNIISMDNMVKGIKRELQKENKLI